MTLGSSFHIIVTISYQFNYQVSSYSKFVNAVFSRDKEGIRLSKFWVIVSNRGRNLTLEVILNHCVYQLAVNAVSLLYIDGV